IATRHLVVDSQGSVENDTQTMVEHKVGGDSFTMHKSGQSVAGQFNISSLTIDRSGAETFHRDTTSNQTWHIVADASGSYENGTASGAMSADGNDAFSMHQ